MNWSGSHQLLDLTGLCFDFVLKTFKLCCKQQENDSPPELCLKCCGQDLVPGLHSHGTLQEFLAQKKHLPSLGPPYGSRHSPTIGSQEGLFLMSEVPL